MAFRGWPAEAIEFYEGLEADNSKVYWQDHKDVYDCMVKGPMDELLAELAAEFGEGKLFRPNRDIRFSTDKSPYKTALGAMVGDSGYVQLSSNGLAAGSGMYVMATDQLDRYRRSVTDEATGAELERIVADGRKRGLDITGHDQLKTAPRGYPRDHPRIHLLRNKGLIAWKEWPVGAWMGTAKAKDRVITFLRGSQPLNAWLDANVGPSDLPPDERRR